MANLAEKNKDGSRGLSLNNCVHPGICKNSKIASAFTFARFDEYLLSYDISKAYHQMRISETNSSKFLFYWFRNVNEGDFTPIVYKFNRVIFGLACSPFMLTCALYKFLIEESSNEEMSGEESKKLVLLKKQIYQGSYVDNIFMGANTFDELKYIHDKSVEIFEENKFPLQQFATNHSIYQKNLDIVHGESTEKTEDFGNGVGFAAR